MNLRWFRLAPDSAGVFLFVLQKVDWSLVLFCLQEKRAALAVLFWLPQLSDHRQIQGR